MGWHQAPRESPWLHDSGAPETRALPAEGHTGKAYTEAECGARASPSCVCLLPGMALAAYSWPIPAGGKCGRAAETRGGEAGSEGDLQTGLEENNSARMCANSSAWELGEQRAKALNPAPPFIRQSQRSAAFPPGCTKLLAKDLGPLGPPFPTPKTLPLWTHPPPSVAHVDEACQAPCVRDSFRGEDPGSGLGQGLVCLAEEWVCLGMEGASWGWQRAVLCSNDGSGLGRKLVGWS